MKRLFPILLSLLSLLPLTARAVEVEHLYSASVMAVNNQSNRTLQKVAFAEVLVKVSGNAEIATNPVIKKALINAREYLVKQAEERVDGERYLQASFNEQKINRLLRSSEFGVWSQNRPQQVIWLVVDENFSRSVKGENDRDYADFIDAIKAQANKRGIPVLFPVMDLDDQLQVSSSDLWGQFTDPVELASTRYGADNYIIAKIIKQNDDYQLNWSMYGRNNNNQPYEVWLNGQGQGELAAIGTKLTDSLANHLGERYSVKASGKDEVVFLNVDAVTDITDYAKLIAMFSELSAVAQVDLDTVTGSNVQLKLVLLGTQQDLLTELSLDQRIQSTENAFGDTNFQWNVIN
ncbi:hypothetical protein AKG98_1005 [Moritella sp. JT01]|uniref:DUF2066 domain-containing protein n=1 Tax=Moritella sp. JT01 TaxID=756698 RepID=UPI00079B0B37|nr:DUF2066 domain-containing protein [Moritella sp. JT01]KXO09909.1 hypothetical protein AKG98_1005 [Moritella sp. JT01]